MHLFQKFKMQRQINKSLKANGFNRWKFKKSMKEHTNRKLDIREILSRDFSYNVVVDAYEYCMRKCNWDTSTLQEGSIKDFLLCELFVDEVGNGGIYQFFSNSSGDMSEETALAMEKIDESAANILQEAMQCFPNGIVPKDRDVRNSLMDQFDEDTIKQLDKLDMIMWDYDISKKCYEFLQKYKSDFLCF